MQRGRRGICVAQTATDATPQVIRKENKLMHRKLLVLSGIVFSGTIALNGNLVWSQTKGSGGTPGAAGQESSDRPTSQKGTGASSSTSSSQDTTGSAGRSSGSTGSGSASGGSSGGSAAGSGGS